MASREHIALSLLAAAILMGTVPVASAAERTFSCEVGPDEVVRIHSAPGIVTEVEFPAGEPVKHFATGFSAAWEIAPRGPLLYLKPKKERGSTNLVVRTPSRSWLLDLIYTGNRNEATYRAVLSDGSGRTSAGPDPVALRIAEAEAARSKELRQAEARRTARLFRASPTPEASRLAPLNRAWSMNFGANPGSPLIAPAAVADNGLFTSLTFRRGAEFPAVFEVTADGESLVPSHVDEAGRLVLHGVYRELRLRAGDAVVGLYNDRFTEPAAPDTGVSLPGLERSVKDQNAVNQPEATE